jgi:hypothetical protein
MYSDAQEMQQRKRPPSIEALLGEGTTQSWINGNSIISITASRDGWVGDASSP